MGELSGKARRKGPIGDTVVIGQFALRHVKGAENEVEDRESSGEVLLTAPVCRGVVPAVKNWPRDDVFERTERPVEIGVDERGMRDGEGAEHQEHVWRNAGNQQHNVGEYR